MLALQNAITKKIKDFAAKTDTSSRSITSFMKSVQQAAATVTEGLGGITAARRCSSAHLVNDKFVIKCTMLDPRFKTFAWRKKLASQVEATTLQACEDEILVEAIKLGTLMTQAQVTQRF